MTRLKELQLHYGDEVNAVTAGIAHHHLTGHVGGGSDVGYQCEECGFEIADGVVVGQGSIIVLDDSGAET